MAALISTAGAPPVQIARANHGPIGVPTRREGPATIDPGEAARELDVEVARLLRVRRGELAEPLLWQRPSVQREVDEVVVQLAPIRSRLALLSSWQREAHRGPSIRLAYAIVWLQLARRRAGEYGPRPRGAQPLGSALRLLRGRG